MSPSLKFILPKPVLQQAVPPVPCAPKRRGAAAARPLRQVLPMLLKNQIHPILSKVWILIKSYVLKANVQKIFPQ